MKLTFSGGVRAVTGSCILMETDSHKILIDCGMFQGEHALERSQEVFNFDPRSIDAVILTHAHYDHSGRLPLLVKQGYDNPIYCTAPTKALSKIILEDAQHVMVDNSHRMGTPVLYDLVDVQETDSLIKVINYHTEFEIVPGVRAMMHDAGHILGSAFISLDIDASHMKNNQNYRFVFSGDIGNEDVPILPPTELIESADIVITESTYGDREHEQVDARMTKLKEIISKVIGRGGTLLIPAFSIERTQELLYELDRLIDANEIPAVPIYLDSPLSIKATEIYQHFASYLRFDRDIFMSPDRDFFSFPNLQITLTVDASKSINQDQSPKIIIAGSGMMNGGRIVHHLKHYIEDQKNGLLIIGYQGMGTLGRKIFDGAKKVKIHREEYQVNAEVQAIGAFSAHGDRIKLRQWLHPVKGQSKTIFLVHGDDDVKVKFKTYLEQEFSNEIIIPQYWQSFDF